MSKNQARPMSRRDFLKISGAFAATTALTACGVKPSASGSEPVQLVYQDWRTDWFPGMAQEMLNEFHALHPNIRVFYTPDPENIEEKMLADMEAGSAPDVFAGCCNFFPVWAQKGYTLDLRPYISDLEKGTIEDWSSAQYEAFFTAEGVQYGLPKYHGALALFYNKDLFDAAGVDYPDEKWNQDDYLAAMKKLTVRKGDTVRQFGGMFDVAWERLQVHVNSFGGHFVDPNDPAKCVMDEKPSLDALEWLRARVWDDRVMASFLDVNNVSTRQAFINQQTAMVEDGSWALRDILEGIKFRMGIAPFPAGPVKKVTLAATDGFGIYKGTKYPEAAWELMKFLVSKDYGRAMARAHFLQPARQSIVPDWVKYIQTEFPDKTKEVDIAAFADGHIKGYSVISETFPNMLGVGDLSKAAFDKIYTLGKSSVADEIKKLAADLEALQKNPSSLVPSHCNCAPIG
jgi:multiple sugar transport system substrate-binding protein